jgi:hypothetical protein
MYPHKAKQEQMEKPERFRWATWDNAAEIIQQQSRNGQPGRNTDGCQIDKTVQNGLNRRKTATKKKNDGIKKPASQVENNRS